MIIYVERDILFDGICQERYLCNSDLDDEYLLLSSNEKCSCKKQKIILCKNDHDQCEKRCLKEKIMYLKRMSQSNQMLLNGCSVSTIQFDKNQFEHNAEIIYICQKHNLPKSIFEHIKKRFILNTNVSNDASLNQTSMNRFLLKYSVFAQQLYGIYSIFQEARKNPFRLRRYANIGYLLANLLLGIIFSLIFYSNIDLSVLISNEILIQTQSLTTAIRNVIEWLMHAPAGLKLNQPLVDFLARFYFYHIYLWSGYLEALVIVVLPYLYQTLFILCLFGIPLATGAICDFIRLLIIHLYCFYIYSARLFNWQIRLLLILFRLFCGKKRNPLRNNRLDSHLCDIDQLFVVTLTFTILLFLLPSIFMYYAVFTSIWTIAVFITKLVQYINYYLLHIPIYEIYLAIIDSKIIKGTPRLAVNYSDSSAHNFSFDFHFDSVTFLTLYRVCNIHPFFASFSFRHVLISIIKGQHTF